MEKSNKYKIGIYNREGYCGVEVINEKENLSPWISNKRDYTEISEEYKDKEYKRGTILKKLGKWQSKKKPGTNSQCRKKLS